MKLQSTRRAIKLGEYENYRFYRDECQNYSQSEVFENNDEVAEH